MQCWPRAVSIGNYENCLELWMFDMTLLLLWFPRKGVLGRLNAHVYPSSLVPAKPAKAT